MAVGVPGNSSATAWQTAPNQWAAICPCSATEKIKFLGILGDLPILLLCCQRHDEGTGCCSLLSEAPLLQTRLLFRVVRATVFADIDKYICLITTTALARAQLRYYNTGNAARQQEAPAECRALGHCLPRTSTSGRRLRARSLSSEHPLWARTGGSKHQPPLAVGTCLACEATKTNRTTAIPVQKRRSKQRRQPGGTEWGRHNQGIATPPRSHGRADAVTRQHAGNGRVIHFGRKRHGSRDGTCGACA